MLTAVVPAGLAAADARPDPRQPGLSAGDRLGALLDRMRLEQASVETMEADFTQVKESKFLLAPAESTGVFSYAAPDRVRWEYRSPDAISLVIRGDQMTTWYRDLDKVEQVQVGRQSQRVLEFLGAGSSLDKLVEYFEVSLAISSDPTQPFRLELEPRYQRIAKRLEHMTVWVDSQRFYLARLRFVTPDGDVTDYRFDRVRVNGGLPQDRFELALPSGVVVETVDFDARFGLR